MTLQRFATRALVLACIAVSTHSSVFAATPEEVKTAIARGQEFLLNTQTNGNWEPPIDPAKKSDNRDLGGYTAIATYALLASGVSPQDPKVKAGIDYLVKLNDMTGIYAIGIRA